jgi:putative ABC transport system permease protein
VKNVSALLRWLNREAGVRFIARHRAASVVAVLTMALALGANTLVFSVTKTFMLNSFAVPDPGRLFVIAPVRELPGRGEVVFAEAYSNYERIRETQRSFADVGVFLQGVASWETNGEARALQSARVSASFFSTVNVRPVHGRTFTPEEEGPNASPVVIVSAGVWHGALGGDPNVLGRVLQINGGPHTVVGVMPPGFGHPQPTDIWLPFDLATPNAWTAVTGARTLGVYGRLKAGVSEEAARAEMPEFTRRALEATNDNRDFRYTLQSIRQVQVPGADRTLRFVQAGALLLVLLAISNLASLFIAWGFERRQEIAVRLAMGAKPSGIVKMLVVQSVVITSLGGLAGLLFARVAVPYVRGLDVSPALAVFLSALRIDWLVLLVSALTVAGAGIIAGVLPARFAGKSSLGDPLRAASRSVSLSPSAIRWQKVMVLVQATLAAIIVSAAALIGVSFRNLSRVPGGFESEGRTVARIQLPGEQYAKHPVRVDFGVRLLENLGRERDLTSFGFTSTLPVGDGTWGSRFFVDPADEALDREPLLLHIRRVSDGYLRTMGIRLMRGRHFDSRDRVDAAPVAIISNSLAARIWPAGDAVGKFLYRVTVGQPLVPLEIVGVVAAVQDAGFNTPPGETVYVHWPQISIAQMSIVATSPGGPDAALLAIRRALRATDPVIAANNTATLESLVRQTNALPQLQTILLVSFAVVALMMVVLGNYGVMSQLVLNREREFALRRLYGATPVKLGSAVLFQAGSLTVAGLAIGLLSVWLMKGLLQPLVFGVDPRSADIFAVVAALLLTLSGSAALAPALRAMRIDVRRIAQTG